MQALGQEPRVEDLQGVPGSALGLMGDTAPVRAAAYKEGQGASAKANRMPP